MDDSSPISSDSGPSLSEAEYRARTTIMQHDLSGNIADNAIVSNIVIALVTYLGLLATILLTALPALEERTQSPTPWAIGFLGIPPILLAYRTLILTAACRQRSIAMWDNLQALQQYGGLDLDDSVGTARQGMIYDIDVILKRKPPLWRLRIASQGLDYTLLYVLVVLLDVYILTQIRTIGPLIGFAVIYSILWIWFAMAFLAYFVFPYPKST